MATPDPIPKLLSEILAELREMRGEVGRIRDAVSRELTRQQQARQEQTKGFERALEYAREAEQKLAQEMRDLRDAFSRRQTNA